MYTEPVGQGSWGYTFHRNSCLHLSKGPKEQNTAVQPPLTLQRRGTALSAVHSNAGGRRRTRTGSPDSQVSHPFQHRATPFLRVALRNLHSNKLLMSVIQAADLQKCWSGERRCPVSEQRHDRAPFLRVLCSVSPGKGATVFPNKITGAGGEVRSGGEASFKVPKGAVWPECFSH